ncbi:MAG: hypothetical protein GX364_00755 [Firmicutes bacterium]|nr:hypothetical protein [Bacillota bacterium]
MKRYFAIFLLGILLGTSMINLLHGRSVDKMYWEKEELKIALFETSKRLSKLEDQLAIRHNPLVREVKIEIETEEDDFTKQALRQAINQIAGDMIGEELSSINPQLLYQMLNKREIKLQDGRIFQTEIMWLVVSDQIIFNLRCSPLNID